MRLFKPNYSHNGGLNNFILTLLLLFAIFQNGRAQEPPPRPLRVTVIQNIVFGAFTLGASGGSVIINSAGGRSATGDVVLLNLGFTYSAAQFQLTANRGTVITILNGPDVLLTRAGGGSMNLHIGISSPASPFVITVPPPTTQLNIGGTLTVGNSVAKPPGSYTGTISITFVQQ